MEAHFCRRVVVSSVLKVLRIAFRVYAVREADVRAGLIVYDKAVDLDAQSYIVNIIREVKEV